MPDDEFLAKLKAFEGREVAGLTAPDEVNQAMIRHWVQAMGDTNPVYVDADAAAASVHGQVIAPAVMLQAWTSQGLRQTSAGRGAGTGPISAQDELLNLVESAGFTSVVATNCEQEYERMLHLGDRLMTRSVIESVSEEKQTGLGVGHFITTRIEYLTTDGEPVGRQLFRILKFKPGTGRNAAAAAPAPAREEPAPVPDAPAPRARRPRPGITPDNAFFFEGAKQHKLLIQQCSACQTLRHPPQPRCDHCGSYEWHALEASGKGTVYSYVVNHHPQVPAFEYPLPLGLIELEEGTRLVAEIVDCPLDRIEVGMPVGVTWIDADEELSLPAFKPTNGSRSAP